MLDWLEEICDGAPLAMWAFSQEGISARLIFAQVNRDLLGGGSDRLILVDDGPEYEHIAMAKVERSALVREVYYAFQAFLRDGYRADQWEYGLPPQLSYEDLTDEEEAYYQSNGLLSWHGHALPRLCSSKIESFLREAQAEQLSLDLRHR